MAEGLYVSVLVMSAQDTVGGRPSRAFLVVGYAAGTIPRANML